MDRPAAAPGDPLAQPVRARAFAFLADLRRPAAIEEIAAHLRLHPSGVRQHLARLEDAGLLERRVVRAGRGRPRYEWAIAPGAMPGGEPPAAYAELASWLAEALAAGATGREALEAHGYEIGRGLAPAAVAESSRDALGDALTAMGFQPRRSDAGGVTTYELCNCPYRDAVRAGGRPVCSLHAGITRGLLQRLEPQARLSDFVAKDPDRAGCLVEVETR
jgi:predicted ArsR family transcriptional regulator